MSAVFILAFEEITVYQRYVNKEIYNSNYDGIEINGPVFPSQFSFAYQHLFQVHVIFILISCWLLNV